MSRSPWHILTGEFPPDPGGVSDYTRQVALGLVKTGYPVTVWTGGRDHDSLKTEGVQVNRVLDRYQTSRLKLLEAELIRFDAATLLVQYVPHGFGWRAMNLPLTHWISRQAKAGRDVRVMFHEVAFPFVKRPVQHNVLSVAHRWMAWTILRYSPVVYTSTSAWDAILGCYAPSGLRTICLPIPSNIPEADLKAAEDFRRTIVQPFFDPSIIGHFGTFGGAIRELALATFKRLLPGGLNRLALLIGRGAQQAALDLQQSVPAAANRIFALENASEKDVAAAVKACDVMLQPYPDGISTRRTSAMAGLANRVAVVTNEGELAEPFWSREGIAAVAASPDPVLLEEQVVRLLADKPIREKQALDGYDAHRRKFSLDSTIDVLLDSRRG